MINLRDMKNELDAMIEERETMCENPDITMDEQSDMDCRIDGQYRDIADIILNDEDIMKAAQEILDKKARAREAEEYNNTPRVPVVKVRLEETGEKIVCLWLGNTPVEEGTKVLVDHLEGDGFMEGKVWKAYKLTPNEYVDNYNMELPGAYRDLEQDIFPVVSVKLNCGENVNFIWTHEKEAKAGQSVVAIDEKGRNYYGTILHTFSVCREGIGFYPANIYPDD